MKFVKYLTFLFVLIIATACPYESTVPIDEPNLKIPKDLIGKWMKSGDVGSENADFFIVSKDSKTNFRVEENSYNSTDEKWDQTFYTGHLSIVDGEDFLNIIEDDTEKYYLYKLNWKGSDEFELKEITNNIEETFYSSAELKAFISKYKDLSFFYNSDPDTYIKRD